MITIFLPVSRPNFLHRVFARLEVLDCDVKDTSLLVYCDGDQRLYEKARNFAANSKFHQRLCIFRAKGNPSVGSVRGRRKRIADIHNEAKKYIKESDYIFCIEDDTLVPANSLTKLRKAIAASTNIAMVSGLELGRWGYKMRGAWKADSVYEPTKIESIGPDVTEVDAVGLYCCLIRSEYYMRHRFEPLENALGPDVNFGLWLRREGMRVLIDQSIRCIHMTKKDDIKVDGEIVTVILEKIKENKWSQGIKL